MEEGFVSRPEAGDYAEAGGDLDVSLGVGDLRQLQRQAEMLGTEAGAGDVGAGEDEEKLFAAVAAYPVVGADRA